MIEAVYAILIVVFASLGVLALFNHLVRGSELREAVAELKENRATVEQQLSDVRAELEDLRFDTDTMDEERVALEKQARCMLSLEEQFKEAQAAALEGDRPRRKDVR